MKQPLLAKQGVPFTQIANAVLSDPKLSLKAKGLFAYLYSKPPTWDYSLHRMVLDLKEGKRAIMMALRELEKTGYLLRQRLPNGRMKYFLRYDPSFNQEDPDCSFSNESKEQHAKTATVSNIVLESNKEEESNKERGETSSPDFRVSKTLSEEVSSPYLGSPMNYFRDEAKRRHHLSYLEYEEDRDAKIKKLIKSAVERLGKEIKPFIDWWFSEAGEWANYAPEACFINKTYRKYENREVIARMKSKNSRVKVI